MLDILVSICWLPLLLPAFQLGRYCLRHSQPGAAVAIFALCLLALACLVLGALFSWR